MSKAGDYLSKRVYDGVVTPSKEEAAWMRKKMGGCAGSAPLQAGRDGFESHILHQSFGRSSIG